MELLRESLFGKVTSLCQITNGRASLYLRYIDILVSHLPEYIFHNHNAASIKSYADFIAKEFVYFMSQEDVYCSYFKDNFCSFLDDLEYEMSFL